MRLTHIATALAVALTAVLVSAGPAVASATPAAAAPTTDGAISAPEAYRQHQAGGASAPDCYLVYFINNANGRYVSAEPNNTGGSYAMLRARAAVWGPWEHFSYYRYL
jgi:hypothetical protein